MTYKVNSDKLRALRHSYYITINRHEKKLSMNELSDIIDVPVGTIFQLENKPNLNYTIKTLNAVCDFYNVEITDILIKKK